MEFIAQFSTVNMRHIILGKRRNLGVDFINEVRAEIPDEEVPIKNIIGVLNGIELMRLNVVIEPEIATELSVFKGTSFVNVRVRRPLNDFLYEKINKNIHSQIKKEYVIDYDGIKRAWSLDGSPLFWYRGSMCKNLLTSLKEGLTRFN